MKNSIRFEIFSEKNNSWVDFSKYTVFTTSFAQFLDQRLDEMTLTMVRVPYSYFEPLTRARITFIVDGRDNMFKTTSSATAYQSTLDSRKGITVTPLLNQETKTIGQEYSIEFFIVEDTALRFPMTTKTVRKLNGNITIKTYTHELSLMETTKFLECFIGDTVTFTNTLGKNYFA